jgi:hypothetical protein
MFLDPGAIHALLAGAIFVCQFRDKIFCDRLINLQTAKIAGAILPISQALQVVLAQPTKGKALM